ncbi:MAG TPA: hypothetical protein VLQ89_00075, partial [Candidatus Binatia bacterium]|nr:hypothetical protein [Candidatus Binatia bacterium]
MEREREKNKTMKTRKIAERANKKNPGKNIGKASKPLSRKRRPGRAKGFEREKDTNITECKRADEA